MSKTRDFLLMFVAMAFAISCSSDDNGEPSPSSSSSSDAVIDTSSSSSSEPSEPSEPSSSSSAPSSSSSDVPSSSSSSAVPSSSSVGGGSSATFVDDRDGKTYKKVTIGTQTWMAENLNYDVPNNAADVCICYDNNPANCTKYGWLYNWAAATKVCPPGWHLPSQAEWNVLTAYIGGANTEGKKLKAASGWNSNGNGTDNYGFSALPGGVGYSEGTFNYGGDYGTWWSASEDNATDAYYRHMHSNEEFAGWRIRPKDYRLSVRCLEN